MEVLIYTTILGVTGTILSGVLLNTTKIKSRQTAVIEVNEQLNFVLQNIQRSIMDSSVIDIENSVSTSTLILKFKDEAKNPTKFYISSADNKVYKKEAGGAPQPLTDDSVVANAVNFLKVSGYSGHDSVQIDLTLSYNTTDLTSTFSRTLSSAIARVSAATFDSNLIPGSGSFYDIGTTALPWNNAYIAAKVGIGTTNPYEKLSLTSGYMTVGNDNVTSARYGDKIIDFGDGTGYVFRIKNRPGGNLVNIRDNGFMTIGNNATAMPDGYLNIYGNGDYTAPYLQVSKAANGDMFMISANGNVGIGTTNPTHPLDVCKSQNSEAILTIQNNNGGTGSASSIMLMDDSGYTKNGQITHFGTNYTTNGLLAAKRTWFTASGGEVMLGTRDAYDLIFHTGGFAVSNERMRITNAGNVGIGTTSPTSQLHFQSTATTGLIPTLSINNYLGGERVRMTYDMNNMKLGFAVGNTLTTPQFTIDGSGQVGIGTTAPGSLLHLESGSNNIALTMSRANGTYAWQIFRDVSAGSETLRAKLSDDVTWHNFITMGEGHTSHAAASLIMQEQGGNVGIGTTNLGEKLEVSGNVKATAFYYSSDERLKNNIQPLSGSLNKILQLQGVSFDWKEDNRSSIGLIAQDVEKIFPELVSTSKQTGLKSIEYANLVAPLIESVKEQQKQIEILKAEISELKLKK